MVDKPLIFLRGGEYVTGGVCWLAIIIPKGKKATKHIPSKNPTRQPSSKIAPFCAFEAELFVFPSGELWTSSLQGKKLTLRILRILGVSCNPLIANLLLTSWHIQVHIWVFPKMGLPQNGWWKSWKTLCRNGWFWGFSTHYFRFNIHLVHPHKSRHCLVLFPIQWPYAVPNWNNIADLARAKEQICTERNGTTRLAKGGGDNSCPCKYILYVYMIYDIYMTNQHLINHHPPSIPPSEIRV